MPTSQTTGAGEVGPGGTTRFLSAGRQVCLSPRARGKPSLCLPTGARHDSTASYVSSPNLFRGGVVSCLFLLFLTSSPQCKRQAQGTHSHRAQGIVIRPRAPLSHTEWTRDSNGGVGERHLLDRHTLSAPINSRSKAPRQCEPFQKQTRAGRKQQSMVREEKGKNKQTTKGIRGK